MLRKFGNEDDCNWWLKLSERENVSSRKTSFCALGKSCPQTPTGSHQQHAPSRPLQPSKTRDSTTKYYSINLYGSIAILIRNFPFVCDINTAHNNGRARTQTKEDQLPSRERVKSTEKTCAKAVVCITHESQSGAQLSQSSSISTHFSGVTITTKSWKASACVCTWRDRHARGVGPRGGAA